MEIPFQINISGESILGMIHMPWRKAKGNPAVIMLYGFNGERVDNSRLSVLCGRLAEQQGVTFVRFDYRGLGLSEGEFWNTTLETKIQDAQTVIKFVSDFCGEQLSIIALGFSDGVRIATNLLEICPHISGLCLWSPVLFPLIDEVHGKIRRKFYREPQTNQLVTPHRGLWVGQQYLRQLSSVDNGYNQVKNSNKPILAVFGDYDPAIIKTQDELEKLIQDGQENIHVKMIPGADHLYSQKKWIEEITNETVRWVLSVGEEIYNMDKR
jgi:alpha/beta superfamily hydrolase